MNMNRFREMQNDHKSLTYQWYVTVTERLHAGQHRETPTIVFSAQCLFQEKNGIS